jgi:RNA polymerase sigma factor (sigma-70 family)
MWQDRLLVWKFNRGSVNALSCIYERYRDDLLRLAMSLLNDVSNAEDIVHDVFLGFAESAGQFRLTGSLKGYLATCVANRARNRNLAGRRRQAVELSADSIVASGAKTPERWVADSEELKQVSDAIARLPYEQREVITLRLHGEMKFRQIAGLQDVSIKTAQSRYRCGLEKLRSLLNSEVQE